MTLLTSAPVTARLGISPEGTAAILAAALTTSLLPLTAVIRQLTGEQLRVETLGQPRTRDLNAAEYHRIDGAGECDDITGWRRAGLLRCAHGVVAAETTLVLLPGRVPPGTIAELEATTRTAGDVLGPLGMTRADRRALPRHGLLDPAGGEVAVTSSAVLVLPRPGGGTWPAGIACEQVTLAFCEHIVRAG